MKNKNKQIQDKIQKQNKDQQQRSLFQFEMANELGATLEKEKEVAKQVYCKDELRQQQKSQLPKKQNNNFNTTKNQFK